MACGSHLRCLVIRDGRVDAKGLLLPTYKLSDVDEISLVVHAGPLNPAQRFDAEAGFDRSQFDRPSIGRSFSTTGNGLKLAAPSLS